MKHLKSTYINTNKSWADIKAGWLRMRHPFLVYTDKPTKTLDQLTAIKHRKTSPHSSPIHTFHVHFWAEDAYFPIHTTISFQTFKQLKFYNLICNFSQVSETVTAWDLQSSQIFCSVDWWLVTNVLGTTYQSISLRITHCPHHFLYNCTPNCSPHSSWTPWPMQIGLIGYPETSVTNY